MELKKDRGLQARMVFVMFLLGLLTVGFGFILGVVMNNLIFTFVFIGLFSVMQLFFSKKIALKSAGAEKVSSEENPELHNLVSNVSQQAGVPKPTVAVSRTSMPNAFAAGRSKDDSVVCVTEGLMQRLDTEELEAVIAHEVAHIKNRDVIVMTLAGLVSAITGFIVRYAFLFGGGRRNNNILVVLLVSVITYILSFLLIRALSRYREYSADRGAAAITGQPNALASALRKIDKSMESTPKEDMRSAQGVSALMISPVGTKLESILSTHPKTEKRIEKLNEMS
jgi:heat shock protein HtpX